MPGDMTFEAKFAQLANSQLAEKVPSLTEYLVGFQLIDKNDEETMAVGVSAYVLNKLFLYIPVFFIEGSLKGMDLLYVYQRDLFVPAADNWISILQQEGVESLGKVNEKKVDTNRNKYYAPGETPTAQYKSVLSYKRASLDDPNSLISFDAVEKMFWKDPETILPDLAADLQKLGKTASRVFINTFLKRPEFANALFTFYSPDELGKLAKDAIYEKAGEPPQDEVIFITNNADEAAIALEDSEKRLLMRNGVYIKDNREDFSQVFQTSVDTGILQNPTEPGIYDVLMADGEYKTFIALFPDDLTAYPRYNRRSKQNVDRPVALIDLASPKKYYKALSSQFLCRPSLDITTKQTESLQGGRKATLQSVQGLAPKPKKENGSTEMYTPYNPYNVIFVQAPDIVIETKLTGRTVEGDILAENNRPEGGVAGTGECAEVGPGGDDNALQIAFIDDEGSLSVNAQALLVPKGSRVFEEHESTKKLKFGDDETLMRLIYKKADMKPLQIQAGKDTAIIYFNGHSTGTINKLAALQTLVLSHGIFAGQAQQLLKEAAREENSTKQFLIKHAAAYDVAAYADSVNPPFQGGPAPYQEPNMRDEERTTQGQPLADSATLPQNVIDRAMAAANAGIKEVFDTSVLSALVDVADLSELRKDYLSEMIKGMDSIGRMLFLFYWHQDNFKERYGDIDMNKLENTLKSVFTSIGDLILFLREKTVYHPEFGEGMFDTLSEDIGGAGLTR